MKNIFFYGIFLFMSWQSGQAQCKNIKNDLNFTYQHHRYKLVKVNKTWKEAAACAVKLGGYLAEINSAGEQQAIYNALRTAGINYKHTLAPDGGGAGYIWLGGNDMHKEGFWIWDGNNDGKGIPFWEGDIDGHPINGHYTNWGYEPDNFRENQNALGMGLTEWPLVSGFLGKAGQWNDLNENNKLYFLIEFDN